MSDDVTAREALPRQYGEGVVGAQEACDGSTKAPVLQSSPVCGVKRRSVQCGSTGVLWSSTAPRRFLKPPTLLSSLHRAGRSMMKLFGCVLVLCALALVCASAEEHTRCRHDERLAKLAVEDPDLYVPS